jgi:hypothetical protein
MTPPKVTPNIQVLMRPGSPGGAQADRWLQPPITHYVFWESGGQVRAGRVLTGHTSSAEECLDMTTSLAERQADQGQYMALGAFFNELRSRIAARHPE